MSDETQSETINETPAPAPPAPVQYRVFSVARGRLNRTARAALPRKPSRKQFIGGSQLRLTAGRPLTISEDFLRKNLEELRRQTESHVLEVRTLDGRLVDLQTLMPIESSNTEANTRPQFPLDSVENDKNLPGLNLPPQYAADDLTLPNVLSPGEKPALFESAEEAARAADEGNAPGDRPTPVDDAELDARIAQAQEEASQEEVAQEEAAPETAPGVKEEVSSEKKGGGSRRRSGR